MPPAASELSHPSDGGKNEPAVPPVGVSWKIAAATATGADRAPAAGKSLSPAEYTAAGVAWTIIRGTAYDLTAFLASGAHPGGDALARLAVGRDATALVESNHLRQDQPMALLKRLPVLHDFPVDQVQAAPRPSDSPLYSSIRRRVVSEVFNGAPRRGYGKGGEAQALISLVLWLAGGALWLTAPSILSGLLFGLSSAFAAMVLFHAGNHGALSSNTRVNAVLALAGDVLGASSLPWRYKHQVSHHIWTGDHSHDADLLSPFPRLRFDARYPKLDKHRWQHVYMWFLFPLMYVTFFINNWKALIVGTAGPVYMSGASTREMSISVGLNLAHIWVVLGQPLWSALSGGAGAPAVSSVLLGALVYATSLSFILGAIFAVSHNMPESKELQPAGKGAGADVAGEESDTTSDWGKAQIYHSANWGGSWANYLTGGLSLQIEHHLFPAVNPTHYPAISRIVEQECVAHGVQYKSYRTFWTIAGRFIQAAHQLGN